ncbi:NADH-quinone oxidoreductase subunit J [Gammaproteobacteria bacterium]|nr:NADH-quinone oxidoreductase subunit J [Gammaproteobacteria bacterium]|tara:strand:+ start:241 stop:858 length:618 start_codon:yes stop_codon:yes gene_type:complete
MIEQIVFYLFGGVLLLSASMVVIMRNPIHSALFLVLSFFASAAIWLLLQAEFLAITLVLVYVGAVMVLFLFVVMMLDINLVTVREGFARFLPVGITVAVFMIAAMGLVVSSDYFISDTYMPIKSIGLDYSNTKELGLTLYTQYLYQFEIAGAILLVAIIAAISLSMSKSKINKSISPEQQVIVKKTDRLRVVKMKAEPNIKSREI